MSKPDWKDAPKWAKWLAMDCGEYWYWYANRPKWDRELGLWRREGDSRMTPAVVAFHSGNGLEPGHSLETRP